MIWTYLVGWNGSLVIKAGVTLQPNARRWRTFVNRGATLQLLHVSALDSDGTDACDLERAVGRWLGGNIPRAFQTKEDAVRHLGNRGGGYMECFQARTPLEYFDALSTCASIMREHPTGHCGTDMRALMHERTNGRTHEESTGYGMHTACMTLRGTTCQ